MIRLGNSGRRISPVAPDRQAAHRRAMTFGDD
jgi:hypothetical protein